MSGHTPTPLGTVGASQHYLSRLISLAYCSCIQNTPILFCNPPYFIKFMRNWMSQQKSGLYLLSMADNLSRHWGWEKMHGKKIHSVKVNSECWNKESFFAHCYVSSMMHDLTLDSDSWVVALLGVGGQEECVPPWWFLMDENKYWFLSCKVLENYASNMCMEEQKSRTHFMLENSTFSSLMIIVPNTNSC